MLIILSWRRLMSRTLTFELQLGIRLRESLTAKGVMYPYHRICKDVYPRLNNKLGDQASKRKPYRVFIPHLQHEIEDVLAQAKWHPYT
jgi:hypothetical protein